MSKQTHDEAWLWSEISALSASCSELLDEVLGCSSIPRVRIARPPNLDLNKDIPRLAFDFKHHEASPDDGKRLAALLERHLQDSAAYVQATFEEHWVQLDDHCESFDVAGQGLVLLHTRHFQDHVRECQAVAMDTVRGHHESNEASAIDWTADSRRLMEQVYQRLPRLEQHEKKTLSEVSGLSMRQITIWFANQRQRKGWPVPLEETNDEEDHHQNVQHASPSSLSSSISSLSSSTSSLALEPMASQSQRQRSPSPVSPGICPSLSSSASSRSSSGSWNSSPTRPGFAFYEVAGPFNGGVGTEQSQGASSLSRTQSSQSIAPASFDVDQLLRQLEGGNPAPPCAGENNSNHNSNNDLNTYFCQMPVQPVIKQESPFSFVKQEQTDLSLGMGMLQNGTTMSTGAWTPNTFINQSQPSVNHLQWLPMSNSHTQTAASLSVTLTEPTPQAYQQTFAPLQLDISNYLQQSTVAPPAAATDESFNGMDSISPSGITRSGASSPFWSDSISSAAPPSEVLQTSLVPSTNFNTAAARELTGSTFNDTLMTGSVPCHSSIFTQSTEDWNEFLVNDLELWSQQTSEQSCESHMQ